MKVYNQRDIKADHQIDIKVYNQRDIKVFKKSLVPEHLPPICTPATPPAQDRQGTEPRATGTSVCPQARLGQAVLAGEKVDPQPEPPCSHRPRSCSGAQGHSAVMGARGSTGGVCWDPSRSHPQLVSGAATAQFGFFVFFF